MEAIESFKAPYHFRDDELFESFIAEAPFARLRTRLRTNDALRNRLLPGFRVTASLPTDRQLAVAYRREIVERNNEPITRSLCAHWLGGRTELVKLALSALEINIVLSKDEKAWIEEINKKVLGAADDSVIIGLVGKLAERFATSDIKIFISIVTSGLDHERVRNLVDGELTTRISDPNAQRKQIEDDLNAAKKDIGNLQQRKVELERLFESKSTETQELLGKLQEEQGQLDERLAQNDKAIGDLVRFIQEKQAELGLQNNERDKIVKEKASKSKALLHHSDKASKSKISIEANIQSIVAIIATESARCEALETRLREAEERLIESTSPDPILTSVQATAETQPDSRLGEPQKAALNPSRGLGTNAVCYQGIQRIFRNAVVAFLRERLSKLFPGDHAQRVKKLFGDEWAKAAANALLSRENLGTTTTVRDDYDLLGTNHFYNVFERFYDRLFTVEAGQHASAPKPVKTRFMGNIKAIKDCRDPLSHPVDEEVSIEEALHLLYSAQEVLKWLGCNTQAAELSTLSAQLRSGESGDLRTVRRLPSEDSIYLDFVGRNTLLKSLSECFANPDNKRCLLAGDGGKGKSAAAFRFVQNLPNPAGRFQLIIWLSAKIRRFREGSSKTIESPDFTTAQEAVDRLLIEYGATTQDMAHDAAEKKRLLFEYLNEFPAFIIADDIDTVLENDDVVGLFTHEIPHTRSAVLLTSRRAIPGIRTFNVPGFDPGESEEFIKSRIRLYGLSAAAFTPSTIKQIASVTDSSPLYMDDLMRVARIVEIHAALKMWADKGGDEARKYALQREIEKLSTDGKKVLVAAAVTDAPISFAELEHILEFAEDRLLSALSELQTLFLFPKAPAVEGEQRYQINLNTKKLVRLVEGKSEFYRRIEDRSKALAGNLPNVNQGLIGSLIRQAILRLNAELHTEAETILLNAIDKYPNAADLHGVLGYVYKRIGRITDARAQFEAAFKLKATSPEMYLHWQKMEIGEKEWLNALSVADKALKIIPDAYEIAERKVYCLRRAGFDFNRRLIAEKAQTMWSEAVEEVRKRIKSPEKLPTGARALNASMYYSVVVCLDMLNQIEERNRWLERWEKEHPDDPQIEIQKEYLVRKRGSMTLSTR